MFSSRAGAHPALEARPSYSQCFLCLLRGHCWRAFHLPVPWASSAKMSKSPVPLPPNNLCLCPSSPAWVSCNSLLSDLSCSPCSFALQPTLHGTKLLFSLSYLFLATLRSMWNFSNHESNPRPLQWKHGVSTTGLPLDVPSSPFNFFNCLVDWRPRRVFVLCRSFLWLRRAGTTFWLRCAGFSSRWLLQSTGPAGHRPRSRGSWAWWLRGT